MYTGTLNSITSGLSVLSLSLLLIVSFSVEASAKRGCSAFGHSCFGGHGKRSYPSSEVKLKEIEVDSPRPGSFDSESSMDEIVLNLSTNEIDQLRDFMKCQNCNFETSRSANRPNYIPLLLRQLLVSSRRPYKTDLISNDK